MRLSAVLLVLLSLAGAWRARAAVAPVEVHLLLTAREDTLLVAWAAAEPASVPHVEWGTDPSLRTAQRSDMVLDDAYVDGPFRSPALYSAELGPLEAGQRYYYRVFDGPEVANASPVLEFVASHRSAAHDFCFAFTADMGVDESAKDVLTRLAAERVAASDKRRLELVVLGGDSAYAHRNDPERSDLEANRWDRFGAQLAPLASHVPWAFALGNHEIGLHRDYKPALHRFKQPGHFYAFDFNAIHFVVLSTDEDYGPDSPQIAFFKSDLSAVSRAKTPWVIVVAHRPIYNSNPYHGSKLPLRAAIGHLLDEHRVDLMLAGHEHWYESTYGIGGGEVHFGHSNGTIFTGDAAERGTLHMTVGTGGGELRPAGVSKRPIWSRKSFDTHFGFARLCVSDAAKLMSVEFISTAVKDALDQFHICRSPPCLTLSVFACRDGMLSPGEEDVDCGGDVCPACTGESSSHVGVSEDDGDELAPSSAESEFSDPESESPVGEPSSFFSTDKLPHSLFSTEKVVNLSMWERENVWMERDAPDSDGDEKAAPVNAAATSHTATIVGAVAGALSVIACASAALAFVFSRRKKLQRTALRGIDDSEQSVHLCSLEDGELEDCT